MFWNRRWLLVFLALAMLVACKREVRVKFKVKSSDAGLVKTSTTGA